MLIIDCEEGETVEQAEARQRAAEKNRPRVVFDMPRAEYDRLPRANFSKLKVLAKSPRHYWHALTEDTPDTNARKLGRVRHIAALEPEKFAQEVAIWRGGRRAGKEWGAFCDANDGREIITEEEAHEVNLAASAVRADRDAAALLHGGRAEVSVLWTHREPSVGGLAGFSIDCKARLDLLCPERIVDLKFVKDASPEGFARATWNYRHHTQGAVYVDGVAAATGKRLPYFIIAAEVAPPYVVQVYEVPERLLDVGREEYRALLQRLHDCRAENRWPGYADGPLELALPGWADTFNDDEDLAGMDLAFAAE